MIGLWEALGDQQPYFEEPDQPWGTDDSSIWRIRTKPGYIFDDAFWDVFQTQGGRICHVTYEGPERKHMAGVGVFELRWSPNESKERLLT